MTHVKYDTQKILRYIEMKLVTFVMEPYSSNRKRIKTNCFYDIDLNKRKKMEGKKNQFSLKIPDRQVTQFLLLQNKIKQKVLMTSKNLFPKN